MDVGMQVCESVCIVERKPEEQVGGGGWLGNRRARDTHLLDTPHHFVLSDLLPCTSITSPLKVIFFK